MTLALIWVRRLHSWLKKWCTLVEKGLLQEKNIIQWKLLDKDSFPMSYYKQIVVFHQFFLHGINLFASWFLRELLSYFQIELIHQNLNSISHIAILSHLYESYIGIPLFQYFSCFASNQNRVAYYCGEVGVQLCVGCCRCLVLMAHYGIYHIMLLGERRSRWQLDGSCQARWNTIDYTCLGRLDA